MNQAFKKHMENMWTIKEINGVKVVDRIVGFGSLPDIKLQLADGSFVSAKKLFEEGQ
jgi:hypothetical protein